jgi:hypothetical protein
MGNCNHSTSTSITAEQNAIFDLKLSSYHSPTGRAPMPDRWDREVHEFKKRDPSLRSGFAQASLRMTIEGVLQQVGLPFPTERRPFGRLRTGVPTSLRFGVQSSPVKSSLMNDPVSLRSRGERSSRDGRSSWMNDPVCAGRTVTSHCVRGTNGASRGAASIGRGR